MSSSYSGEGGLSTHKNAIIEMENYDSSESNTDNSSESNTDDSDGNALQLRPKRNKTKRKTRSNVNRKRNSNENRKRNSNVNRKRNKYKRNKAADVNTDDQYHKKYKTQSNTMPSTRSSQSERKKKKKKPSKRRSTAKTSKKQTKASITYHNTDHNTKNEGKANKTTNTKTSKLSENKNSEDDKNDINELKECWKYCDSNILKLVFVAIIMICGVYIGVGYGLEYAATQIIDAQEYQNEATKELCLIKSVESEECTFSCDCNDDGACSTCYSTQYKYTATVQDKCGDLIINSGAGNDDCPGSEYDVDTEQTCYVKDCEDQEFSFHHHGVLYIVPIVIIAFASCFCFCVSIMLYFLLRDCINGGSMTINNYVYTMKPCCILTDYGVYTEPEPEDDNW